MPERDPEAEKREAVRASLYEVLELATKFFEESCKAGPAPLPAATCRTAASGPTCSAASVIGYARADRNA